MSAQAPISVIQNGLVLCLDAANTKSYPGTGTTWTDISKNGNNGTLTNGPTFNSANGGSIGFNGTNSRVSFSNSGSTTSFDFGTGNFSVLFWIYPTAWADNTSRGIISKKANDSKNGWVIYNDGNFPTKINARLGTTNNFPSTTAVTTNIWQYWALTRASTTLTWYYNGNLDVTGTNSANVSDTTVELQIGHSQTWDGWFKGQMGIISFYNRALTPSEILQNYNSTKSRFGL